jgi:hypothetical protein
MWEILIEGRGGKRRGGILITFVFGSNEGRGSKELWLNICLVYKGRGGEGRDSKTNLLFYPCHLTIISWFKTIHFINNQTKYENLITENSKNNWIQNSNNIWCSKILEHF